MTNTCPNCSHPLRPGAQYCGYCGTDVSATKKSSVSNTAALDGGTSYGAVKSITGAKTRRRDRGKVISVIAIILLVLVILSALAVQYWATIYPYLNLYFPTLFPK